MTAEEKLANLIREVNALKDAADIVRTQVDEYAERINVEIVEHVKLDDLRISIASVEELLNDMEIGDAVGKEKVQPE